MNNIKKASGFLLLAFSLTTIAHSQSISTLKNLNSPYDEQHPVISPTEEIFYSVGYHPENLGGETDFGDIWMTKKTPNGEWGTPVHVKSLSTAGNDVIVGFPDALTAYVYHSGSGNGKSQGIHQYSRFGSEWNYVRPLEMGNFRNQGSHFSGRLSQDHSVIIMSMNSFGSYGNEDIYVSRQIREGSWSSPQNLGTDINTFSQELTPSLSKDLKTLYFSTNSNTSNSGRNIYSSQRLDDTWENWSKPSQMEKVNSSGAELSYVVFEELGNIAFYTSTQNSEGFGDLMMVIHQDEEKSVEETLAISQKNAEPQTEIVETIEEEKAEIIEEKSETVEEKTVENIEEKSVAISTEKVKEAPVEVIEEVIDSAMVSAEESNSTNYKVLDANTSEAIPFIITYTNKQGIKKNAGDFSILQNEIENNSLDRFVVSSNGYIPKDFGSEEWSKYNSESILLMPVKAGASIVLSNIQFNRGTSDFADARSIQLLDDLVEFMKINSTLRVRLEGHTDNVGDPQLNKELSMNRASKIRGYLTLKGIDFERIRITGWGGSKPIADTNTEEGRAQNRRVELVIDRLQ
ncbi:OmpA family protein [Belliella sp. DSM 107340]|uniref:OmpA family protein n=1 Tax=Belliella calami TaxID=2923436 RepID=A0ABS9UNG1_9BACT|nr:OmpA family protein [Belliella calami]MCH7398068.1 OmpA family protein [Belliella calami]